MKKNKIGYVPYLPDLSQPGDRRRFPHFAMRNNINFEIASSKLEYDIVLLTAPSNLSRWLDYKERHPNTKFIFEMTDSLIHSPDLYTRLFKGMGRFIKRKEDRLYLNYQTLLYRWLELADVVICSGEEVKNKIQRVNPNVFVSLDYMGHEVEVRKESFEVGNKMKLVWEGQGSVLPQFLAFREMLAEVSSFCDLHVITDETYPVRGGALLKDTRAFLDRLPIKTVFHKWEMHKNYKDLIHCDCAIIPINKNNTLAWHKPANKLISFWFAGIPTVVSDTPAYSRMMDDAGISLYCADTDTWIKNICKVYNMSMEERRELSRQAEIYNREYNSAEQLDKIWQNIFAAVT